MSAIPASPSLYIPFGARQPIDSKAYDSYDEFDVPSESEPPFAGNASDSASESPPTQQQGVFVSEAELLALKQWAARTEEELKQQVTARDEEMRVLRDRLAASEAALRAAQRKDGARRRDLEVAEEDEDVPSGASSRHARRSSRETNALALELSSRRRAEGSARRRAESSKLQSEWRAARTALASAKAPDESAKAVAADAEGS